MIFAIFSLFYLVLFMNFKENFSVTHVQTVKTLFSELQGQYLAPRQLVVHSGILGPSPMAVEDLLSALKILSGNDH